MLLLNQKSSYFKKTLKISPFQFSDINNVLFFFFRYGIRLLKLPPLFSGDSFVRVLLPLLATGIHFPFRMFNVLLLFLIAKSLASGNKELNDKTLKVDLKDYPIGCGELHTIVERKAREFAKAKELEIEFNTRFTDTSDPKTGLTVKLDNEELKDEVERQLTELIKKTTCKQFGGALRIVYPTRCEIKEGAFDPGFTSVTETVHSGQDLIIQHFDEHTSQKLKQKILEQFPHCLDKKSEPDVTPQASQAVSTTQQKSGAKIRLRTNTNKVFDDMLEKRKGLTQNPHAISDEPVNTHVQSPAGSQIEPVTEVKDHKEEPQQAAPDQAADAESSMTTLNIDDNNKHDESIDNLKGLSKAHEILAYVLPLFLVIISALAVFFSDSQLVRLIVIGISMAITIGLFIYLCFQVNKNTTEEKT